MYTHKLLLVAYLSKGAWKEYNTDNGIDNTIPKL